MSGDPRAWTDQEVQDASTWGLCEECGAPRGVVHTTSEDGGQLTLLVCHRDPGHEAAW
jgi:hypothetical protein